GEAGPPAAPGAEVLPERPPLQGQPGPPVRAAAIRRQARSPRADSPSRKAPQGPEQPRARALRAPELPQAGMVRMSAPPWAGASRGLQPGPPAHGQRAVEPLSGAAPPAAAPGAGKRRPAG